MKSPEYIQKLIAVLSKSPKEDYTNLLKRFNFEIIDFEPFQHWSVNKYTRNCLYKDADFEVILLCWEQGQETPIHGHDGEDCWVYLLEGELQEVFYTKGAENSLKEERYQYIKPDGLSFMNDHIGFHKLRNSHVGRSLSLHIYAKPIKRCRFYDETAKHFIETQLNYDTMTSLVKLE